MESGSESLVALTEKEGAMDALVKAMAEMMMMTMEVGVLSA